jgi:DedD protein
MDSRAKQRLTGAIILVALFVLLVPELLTGPRSTDTPAEPQSDEGMRRYTIDLNASTPAKPTEPVSQPTVALPPVSPGSQESPLELATPGEPAAPVAQPSAAKVDEPATAVATPPKSTGPDAPVSPPAIRAQATPSAATVPAQRGTFVVQLGSFGSRDNAERLVRDMTAKGFAAFVAPITSGGRELYRVRVGPTRDRPAAEALAAQLRRIGQSGSIVPIS